MISLIPRRHHGDQRMYITFRIAGQAVFITRFTEYQVPLNHRYALSVADHGGLPAYYYSTVPCRLNGGVSRCRSPAECATGLDITRTPAGFIRIEYPSPETGPVASMEIIHHIPRKGIKGYMFHGGYCYCLFRGLSPIPDATEVKLPHPFRKRLFGTRAVTHSERGSVFINFAQAGFPVERISPSLSLHPLRRPCGKNVTSRYRFLVSRTPQRSLTLFIRVSLFTIYRVRLPVPISPSSS